VFFLLALFLLHLALHCARTTSILSGNIFGNEFFDEREAEDADKRTTLDYLLRPSNTARTRFSVRKTTLHFTMRNSKIIYYEMIAAAAVVRV